MRRCENGKTRFIGLFAALFAFGIVPCAAAVPITVAADDREASFISPPPKNDAGLAGPEEEAVVVQAPTPLVPQPSAPVSSSKEERAENPPATAAPAPVAATPAPVLPPPEAPVDLGKPVDKAPIPDVSPESFGLLSNQNGGLGAAMWKDTSRRMIDKLLPALALPSDSFVLNDLARRFLLTVAAVPDDHSENAGKPLPDLVSLRVEKLLALGFVDDAWKLAALAPRGKIDQIALRQVTEATLIKRGDHNVCAEIPALVAAYGQGGEGVTEWQKSLMYCQLKAGDKKAAQLSLDLLREQKIADDLVLDIAEAVVLRAGKKLPENLSPLRPIAFGLLDIARAPLPSNVYRATSAALMPEIFLAKAVDDAARLDYAERAASAGHVTSSQLAEIYKSATFPSDAQVPEKPQNAKERAQVYQAALLRQEPQERMALVQNVAQGVSDLALAGSLGGLLSALVEDVPATAENGVYAVQAARLFALSGHPEKALAWLKLARELAPRFAEIGVQLASRWPLFVLSGLEPDGAYAQGLKDWLFVALMPGSVEQNRARRSYAARILMLLSSAGYAVSEDAWLRVADVVPARKETTPSPFLLERLSLAAQGERKGETVLLSLLSAGGQGEPSAFIAQTTIVKALRRVGLHAEAQAFAKEVAAAEPMP